MQADKDAELDDAERRYHYAEDYYGPGARKD